MPFTSTSLTLCSLCAYLRGLTLIGGSLPVWISCSTGNVFAGGHPVRGSSSAGYCRSSWRNNSLSSAPMCPIRSSPSLLSGFASPNFSSNHLFTLAFVNSPSNSITVMSSLVGAHVPSTSRDGSLVVAPIKFNTGTTILPPRTVVCVGANSRLALVLGLSMKTPTAPSGAATATATFLHVWVCMRARRTSRTLAG
ncbi:hypothetical protein PF005_g24799 [Phytophthora fragariae]|uniref:Secreted protein n=2 Tax=Phytophthora fragariae TaxID=53985 RepID=A0A6A3E7J0_9STRA|nr:hypothetical protein PF009_g23960 [Phytophthora fragariae]KAE9071807.1 hypothetical protein PF010_g25726 [Phytophthora fragariae]KAE9095269.1 hypothetical protein PF006_g24059 [Phytophthora fragariae]KAE9176719.1 hypothetical protein PF005_g24799 [Phytophthora fragariae]